MVRVQYKSDVFWFWFLSVRRFAFFVLRQVLPLFFFEQSLSYAAASFFKATSEGCGVGHCRPSQTCSSTRHIHRITASRPSRNGGSEDAADQDFRHASHGRMDGINCHHRLSRRMRSCRSSRLYRFLNPKVAVGLTSSGVSGIGTGLYVAEGVV